MFLIRACVCVCLWVSAGVGDARSDGFADHSNECTLTLKFREYLFLVENTFMRLTYNTFYKQDTSSHCI